MMVPRRSAGGSAEPDRSTAANCAAGFSKKLLGELLVSSGQSEEGGKLYREALDSFAKLVAEFPANLGYVRDLEGCQGRVAATISDVTSPIGTNTTPGTVN
jgi:hypothetical protein